MIMTNWFWAQQQKRNYLISLFVFCSVIAVVAVGAVVVVAF